MDQSYTNTVDVLPVPVAYNEPCSVGSVITLSLKRRLGFPSEKRNYQVMSEGILKEVDEPQVNQVFVFSTGDLFFTKDQDAKRAYLYRVLESKHRESPCKLLDTLVLEDKKSEIEKERVNKIFALSTIKLVLATAAVAFVLIAIVQFFTETFKSTLSYIPTILNGLGQGLPLAGVLTCILVCGALAFLLGRDNPALVQFLIIAAVLVLLAVPLMYVATLSLLLLIVAAFIVVIAGVFFFFLYGVNQEGGILYQGDSYTAYQLSSQQEATQLGLGEFFSPTSPFIVASKESMKKLLPGGTQDIS